MPARLRLALTADLHWGTHERGVAATRLLLRSLEAEPPDVLVLAGDVGAGEHFEECLRLFEPLPCRNALVPGNHDVWVEAALQRLLVVADQDGGARHGGVKVRAEVDRLDALIGSPLGLGSVLLAGQLLLQHVEAKAGELPHQLLVLAAHHQQRRGRVGAELHAHHRAAAGQTVHQFGPRCA